MRVRTVVAGALLAMALVGPGVAQAVQPVLYSTTTGASTWNYTNRSNQTGVILKDTSADNSSVLGNQVLRGTQSWQKPGVVETLRNYNGSGTTTSSGGYFNTYIVQHRAGVSVQWQPDRWGPWKYPAQQ